MSGRPAALARTMPEAAGAAASGRIVFADQLRGVAILAVVTSHVFAVYPYMQPVVSMLVAAPPQTVPVGLVTRLISTPWFNPGPFGVALFFLVSGFVVPISLRQHSPATFLLARALRIYPVYWAAIATECGVIWALSSVWGSAFPIDWDRLVSNALLLHLQQGVLTIDTVNWSLVIEVIFYSVLLLLRPLVLRRSLWTIALGTAPAVLLVSGQLLGAISAQSALAFEATLIPFMLIGTLFSFHLDDALSGSALVATVLGMVCLFAVLFTYGPMTASPFGNALNYLSALGLFSAAYATRRHTRRSAVLAFLARVSYPLYLIHTLVGFSLLSWLIGRWHLPFAAAVPVAATVVLPTAWLLHRTVEVRCIALGSALRGGFGSFRVSARPGPRPAPAGAEPPR